jgi:hypothetical protein
VATLSGRAPTRGAPTGPAHSPCSRPHARPAPVLTERDWWALTPPFHPWPPAGVGLLSVAVVVTRGLLSGRPHLLFRGAAFPQLRGQESGSSSPRTDLLPLRLPCSHKPAVLFLRIAGVLEVFHRACRARVTFPAQALLLSRLSASFVGRFPKGPPESPAPCWLTVATLYPLGNCDIIPARNQPGCSDSARSSFSSLLTA